MASLLHLSTGVDIYVEAAGNRPRRFVQNDRQGRWLSGCAEGGGSMGGLRGNCLIAQSGGPTAVINASICGVIQQAMRHPEIEGIYGAQHGVVGVLNEDLVDLRQEEAQELELLQSTPGAALGSVRHRLPAPGDDPAQYQRILAVFEAHNIRYFFCAGGNDSMDTLSKVSRHAAARGHEFRAVGVPKTVDNDLAGTDHCPGYGSVAKHVAAITMGVGLDMMAMHLSDPIVVMEMMGRNAGWITAATALARRPCGGLARWEPGDAPNLIYVPEASWSRERFLEDVRECHARYGWCLIAICGSVRDEHGDYIAMQRGKFSEDAFGHVQLGGVGQFVEGLVREELGLKTRLIRLGPAERIAMHFASLTDRDEAYQLGVFAVQSAVGGVTGKMVGLRRVSNSPYRCEPTLTDLDAVANEEKLIPREWLNEAGNDVTQDFLDYALPLIQGEVPTPIVDGLPRYARLKEVGVQKKLPEWRQP